MKSGIVFSAFLVATVLAVPAAGESAKPPNPSGFGEATSQNAQAGRTGGFVSDLAVSNPPGTVAQDVEAARDALGATPTPPGNPTTDE